MRVIDFREVESLRTWIAWAKNLLENESAPASIGMMDDFGRGCRFDFNVPLSVYAPALKQEISERQQLLKNKCAELHRMIDGN